MDEVLLVICIVLQHFMNLLMPRAGNAGHILSWEGGKDDAVLVAMKILCYNKKRSVLNPLEF